MPMKPTEREYRNFTVSIIEEVQQEEQEHREARHMGVEGYASVFNVEYPLYDDGAVRIFERVAPTAFDEADISDVIFQYDHAGRVMARTKNGTLRVAPNDFGFLVNAELGGTELGRGLWEEIRGGYTDKMSFGFLVDAVTWEQRIAADGAEEHIRIIERIKKVFDVSAVSLPANDATSISVRSLTSGVLERLQAERLAAAEMEIKRKRAILRARL